MTDRFQTESNFQGDLWKELISLISFPLRSFVSAINASKNCSRKNARNTHVPENVHFIMQSTFPGVLTGENCIGVGTILEGQ